jgi:hypothetical protein
MALRKYEPENYDKSINLNVIQRKRIFYGLNAARYLFGVMRGKIGVTAERRDKAANSLLSIGFAGVPPMPQANISFPQWVTSIVETRIVQLRGDRDQVSDRGGDRALPDQTGERKVDDSVCYVQKSINGEMQDPAIRDVSQTSPTTSGDRHTDNGIVPDSSPPEGYRYTGYVTKSGSRELEKIKEEDK